MSMRFGDWTWVDDHRWGEWFLYAPGEDRFVCSVSKDLSDPARLTDRCWAVTTAGQQRGGYNPSVERLTLEEAKKWAEDNLIPDAEKLARLGRPLPERKVIR